MMKILLLAALAIGIAGPAHADPISAAVAWVGSTFAVGVATATAVVQMAIGIGSKILAGVLGKAMADQPKVNVQFDVELGDDSPLAFIAGDYVTAGKRKYLGSWGKNARYITEVIEVSCLPQPGLAGLWVNDEAGTVLWGQVDADGTPHNLGHPVTNLDDDGHRIWVRWVDGTQIAADQMLTDLFGSTDIYPYYGDGDDYPWTADMIGTGKSYVIVTTRYDSDTLTSYPSYLWQPEPLPMYDPRKDGSTGGTGSHRWGNRATYEPSRNNAVIAYNVARGIYYGSEWIFGGRNLPAWRLPRAEWVAAMTACDRAITLAAGGTEPAYRCGLQITADMTAADVLEEIGRAGNMRFAEVGGMLKPIVGLPGAAAFALTDADILITEGQSYKPFNGLSETYNALSATYPEPGEKWSTKDAPEFIYAAATADDGGRYLPTSIAYPAAPYRRQVQRLMRAQMRDYRRFRLHQFYLPPDAYGLEPLVDVVSWTSARNGYLNKLFVVESVSKTPGMNVLVTLREVDPSDYDWSSDFEQATSIVTPKPVRPWVQAVAGFGATAVIVTDNTTKARSVALRASCGGDEVGVTHIRLQVRKSGEVDASIDVQRPYGAPYAWLIHTVNQRTTYQVRGLLMSELTPKGAWSGWITVTTGSVYVDDSDFVGGVTGLFTGAGMKMTRDIADRSVPGAFVGELAWSRADSKIYRWNGSAWVHFIQESLNGILDETAFAASIRIPKTVTAFPTTGQRIGDLVILTTDRQMYRWNGTKWTAEVLAEQIVGKLTAVQIGAGAIGVEQLAAGAATIAKLAITDWANLVTDPNGLDLGQWRINAAATSIGQWRGAATQASTGLTVLSKDGEYAEFTNTTTGKLTPDESNGLTVRPGESYYIRADIHKNASDNTPFRLHLGFRITNGETTVSAYPRINFDYAVNANGWRVLEGIITIPDLVDGKPAKSAIIMGGISASTTVAGIRAIFANMEVRRANAGELTVDGTIRAKHIEFETLTGGLMAPTGIITKTAQIENLVVTNAKLANATIEGAKIATLTVDTLNIKDGAVTQVRSINNWGTGVGGDNSSTWVDVLSITWTSAKAGLHLQSVRMRRKASSGGAGTVAGRILLNGAVVALPDGEIQVEFKNPGTVDDGPIREFNFIRSLGAGSHTMKIQFRTSGFHGTLAGEITDLEWYK